MCFEFSRCSSSIDMPFTHFHTLFCLDLPLHFCDIDSDSRHHIIVIVQHITYIIHIYIYIYIYIHIWSYMCACTCLFVYLSHAIPVRYIHLHLHSFTSHNISSLGKSTLGYAMIDSNSSSSQAPAKSHSEYWTPSTWFVGRIHMKTQVYSISSTLLSMIWIWR